MRRLITVIATILVLAAGTGLAFACVGGASGHGNAGHDQYHEKPGCGPWKSGGYAGGSGYHHGQPPKDHDRGDCPKPPCDRYSRWSPFATGSGHHDGDCDDDCRRHYSGLTNGGRARYDKRCDEDCDRNPYSGYGYDGHHSGDGDCRRSFQRRSAAVPATPA